MEKQNEKPYVKQDPTHLIQKLEPNEIFVFGSNTAGRHGKGTAKQALLQFGAKYGQGEGLQGQSYALPTKDDYIKTLPLEAIEHHIGKFINVARHHPEKTFLMTPIGCGLAGYKPHQIKQLLAKFDLPANIVLPKVFQ